MRIFRSENVRYLPVAMMLFAAVACSKEESRDSAAVLGVRDLRFLRREGGVQLWEGSVR